MSWDYLHNEWDSKAHSEIVREAERWRRMHDFKLRKIFVEYEKVEREQKDYKIVICSRPMCGTPVAYIKHDDVPPENLICRFCINDEDAFNCALHPPNRTITEHTQYIFRALDRRLCMAENLRVNLLNWVCDLFNSNPDDCF